MRSLFAPKSGIRLRDYQQAALDDLRVGFRQGHRRQVLCAPTGAGKTHIAGELIRSATAKGSRVLFTMDRLALVDQTRERLAEAGIQHGVLAGDRSADTDAQVLVASVQTLARRGIPDADLMVVDECHIQSKALHRWMVDRNQTAIGLSATPFTKGLGKIYSRIVNADTTRRLIDDGWLVPLDVFNGTEINMVNAPTTTSGEWTAETVAERAIPVIGDIISEWVTHTRNEFGGPVKTLVFASTVAFGEDLCGQFRAAGFDFRVASYRDRPEDRARNIIDFRNGTALGLISCEVFTRGFDVPDVLCISNSRPYRTSLASVIQQIGRGMRPAENKTRCLLLDHARNFARHAPDIESFWERGCSDLDMGRKKKGGKKKRERKARREECPSCGSKIGPSDNPCPICGAAIPWRQADIDIRPGRMVRYLRDERHIDDVWPHVSRLAIDRHPTDAQRAQSFALAQFRNLTGKWPGRGRELEPVEECDPVIAAAVRKSLRAFFARNRKRTS